MSSQLVGFPFQAQKEMSHTLHCFSLPSMLLGLVFAEGVENLTNGTVKSPVFKFTCETERPGKLVTLISWGGPRDSAFLG